jgi:hypothetical protein
LRSSMPFPTRRDAARISEGAVAAALGERAGDLPAWPAMIEPVDVVSAKLPDDPSD